MNILKGNAIKQAVQSLRIGRQEVKISLLQRKNKSLNKQVEKLQEQVNKNEKQLKSEKIKILKDEIFCYKVVLAVASCFFFTVLAVFIFNQM